MILENTLCEQLGIKHYSYGKDFDIYYLVFANPNLKEFRDGLSDGIAQGLIDGFLDGLAKNKNVLRLHSRSKQIKKNLYRFSATGQIRLMCFQDYANSFFITHAFIKKKEGIISPEEIKKAMRLRNEYFLRKEKCLK